MTVDYSAMSPGEMYMAVGADARKWAEAFIQITAGQPIDEEIMLGWFANAMCAQEDFSNGTPILCGDHAAWLLEERNASS